jgi:hypothetical protein
MCLCTLLLLLCLLVRVFTRVYITYNMCDACVLAHSRARTRLYVWYVCGLWVCVRVRLLCTVALYGCALMWLFFARLFDFYGLSLPPSHSRPACPALVTVWSYIHISAAAWKEVRAARMAGSLCCNAVFIDSFPVVSSIARS